MDKRLTLERLATRFLPHRAKKICLALMVITSLVGAVIQISDVQAARYLNIDSTCQAFTQVNDSAFGLGGGADSTYSSEEGFEVVVFKDQLYLGMEADNSFGARIWRTKAGVVQPASQADWEEVAADANGYPFGVSNIAQNDHIDSLAVFDGYLYASTANGGTSKHGTRIFRSPNGAANSWEDAIEAYGAGFGDIYNTNFKDMQVFQGYLCGGTQNWNVGTQLWCTSDGTTWTQKNISGFGSSFYDNRTVEVWSGFVYNDALYFGVQNLGALRSDISDDVAKVFRTFDINGTPTWREVFSGTAGSYRADILGELDGYIYISTRSSGGIAIFRSSSGDAGTWTQVNVSGMDGDVNNLYSVVDNAVLYNGNLYMAVVNSAEGLELWRTSGELVDESHVDWEMVGSNGLGNTQNTHAQLITFNDNLYAWTSNYSSGQEVLYTTCRTQESTATDTPQPTITSPSPPVPVLTETPLPSNTPMLTEGADEIPATETPVPTPTIPPSETQSPIICTDNLEDCTIQGYDYHVTFLPIVVSVP